jgi:hypothetical protein
LFWSEAGEWKVFGPDILQEAEKEVRMVRENLRVAQSRQKSYVDHRRRELSFEVGDFVYLKMSPMRGLRCFKVWGKLALRFIGPFKILEKRGEVAYQLELLAQFSDVHDVFHVSQLKKCLHVPWEQLPMEDLDTKEVFCQDFRNIREGYAKQEDHDVQGVVQSPYWGGSYLGKGRGIEGGVFNFLF